MKEYTKKVWQCDHCNRVSTSKSGMNRHEVACNKNPQNIRICQGCDHLKMVEQDYYYDTYCGEGHKKVQVLFCEKLNEYKYPPKIERNQGGYEFGDFLNTSMPFECEHFTEKTYDFLQ